MVKVTVTLTPIAVTALDTLREGKGRSDYIAELIEKARKKGGISKKYLIAKAMQDQNKMQRPYRFTSVPGLFNVLHFVIAKERGMSLSDARFERIAQRLHEQVGPMRKSLRSKNGSFNRVKRDYERWKRNGFETPEGLKELKWRQMAVDLRQHWNDVMKVRE